ncbi:hypothetical protein GCM10023201_15850 [Actinomycetospora corticicola]|uniref:Uncharacterized protein n=1 Tax=Actinomycetospora corticicola TaxID=663602 RepID=A0A7Y9DV22_9PSEU|nr:hypothetical protein [Actinomycetospora corticicola]NYD36057.1 hypothetical protein [Actinomycetospora corticicola]
MTTTGRTTDEHGTREQESRRTVSDLLATPGAVRGVVAVLVLLAIYVIGALSHLHVLGL